MLACQTMLENVGPGRGQAANVFGENNIFRVVDCLAHLSAVCHDLLHVSGSLDFCVLICNQYLHGGLRVFFFVAFHSLPVFVPRVLLQGLSNFGELANGTKAHSGHFSLVMRTDGVGTNHRAVFQASDQTLIIEP